MRRFVRRTGACLVGIGAMLSGAAAPPAPEDIIVTVNGVPIREKQIVEEADARIDANKARDAKKGLVFEESARDAMRELMRQRTLHTLMERVLIAGQLTADGIEVTDAEVDARFMEKAKKAGQTIEQAEQQIREQGMTIRGIKERLRWHTLAVEKLYEVHARDKKVLTDAEARQIYDSYPAEFDREEERRVSHILIRSNMEAAPEVKDAARRKAQDLLVRLRAGEGFAELARDFSEDELSKARGGDRGYSTRGRVVSPSDDRFGHIAFSMKSVGDISEVVETRDGYHIILLTDIRPAGRLPYEEVKERLVEDFRNREIGQFWHEFGEALHAKATIEWNPNETARQAVNDDRQRQLDEEIEKRIAEQRARDAANGATDGDAGIAPAGELRPTPAK